MAVLLDISWKDVNGVTSSNSFSIDTAANAVAVLDAVRKLSNAQVTAANILTPVDITAMAANGAAAASNVESAKFKMAIHLSAAPPTGATSRPGATIQIPAPVGTYVNGLSGDPANADIAALLTHIVSNMGVAFTKVDSVNFVR